jgi:hypothetical protein
MTQKNKDRQYNDYEHKFKEIFYVGILDSNNIVKDTQKYEKIRELREHLNDLLGDNQECLEKTNNIIKSKEIKDTSKTLLIECQNLRLLIAMRLDVMTKPFENMKRLDVNKLERIVR